MEEVTICIPAFNEEDVILPTINTLLLLCDSYTLVKWKIVVVDNCSDDKTAAVVQSHPDSRVALLQHSVKGKGAALSYAALKCTSDMLVYMDADLSADPKHILELLLEIQKGSDIAVGSRLLKNENVHRSLWRTASAQIFRLYANLMVPVPVNDSQCGLKMMNRKGFEILATCKDRSWFFDRELLAKAAKRNLVIAEVPVSWEEFRYPERKSKLHVFQAGLQSIYRLWHIANEVRKFK